METTVDGKIITDNSKTCIDQPSNLMMSLSTIFAFIALVLMYKYTNKRGFWWGLLFFMGGGAIGTAVGRVISPPKEVTCF